MDLFTRMHVLLHSTSNWALMTMSKSILLTLVQDSLSYAWTTTSVDYNIFTFLHTICPIFFVHVSNLGILKIHVHCKRAFINCLVLQIYQMVMSSSKSGHNEAVLKTSSFLFDCEFT